MLLVQVQPSRTTQLPCWLVSAARLLMRQVAAPPALTSPTTREPVLYAQRWK
jgi:hypothetical protein